MNLVSGWFKKYFEEKSLNENIENDTKTYTQKILSYSAIKIILIVALTL